MANIYKYYVCYGLDFHDFGIRVRKISYLLCPWLPVFSVGCQVGVAGYGQWQTTNSSGSFVIPGFQPFKYGVNAVGVAANVFALKQRVNVGFKYYWQYGAQATVEGQSLQITAAITF